jgi:plastocyanin
MADVVVWLDAPSAPRPRERRFVVHQRNMQFEPRVLVAPVGSTVDLPNNDRVFHNVFSFTNGKPFDSRALSHRREQADHARPRRREPPLLQHPSAHGRLHRGGGQPYYATSDRAGSFSIADVPAGRYTYHAWRSGAETLSATVLVGDGQPLDISW